MKIQGKGKEIRRGGEKKEREVKREKNDDDNDPSSGIIILCKFWANFPFIILCIFSFVL